MKNKCQSIVCYILMAIFCISCKVIKEDGHYASISFSKEEGKIVFTCDTISKHFFKISADGYIIHAGYANNMEELSIYNFINIGQEQPKEIALLGARNDGVIPLRVEVENLIDTLLSFKLKANTFKDTNIKFTGPGASISESFSDEKWDDELKRWLYKRKEHLDDSTYVTFRNYYLSLRASNNEEFYTKGKIPVLHSLENVKYKIQSSLEADYYYVIASDNQDYIDKCIEDFVVNNFKEASTSLDKPLKCFYKQNVSGYRCLFLVGVNKDWSFTQIPFATLAIDNIAPRSFYVGLNENSSINRDKIMWETSTTGNYNGKDILFFKNANIHLPSDRPLIYGKAWAQVSTFSGNGLSCNVTFKFLAVGDTKSITIHRRGDLCYRMPYDSEYSTPPIDKVISADECRTMYTFVFKLHLEDGDNSIPITVEDYNGNITKGNIIVNCQSSSTDQPRINIENNIENNIDNF